MKGIRRKRIAVVAAAVATALGAPASGLAAPISAVIDFEGLPAGTIVGGVSSGSGISGDPIAGSVGVFGDSGNSSITTNAAIIFDAVCGGSMLGCSGGDADLFKPALGKVLIMAERLTDGNGDGLVDDPDDADLRNATFTFDYSGFGTGSVIVESIDVMDIESSVEEPATIELYGAGGTLLATIDIPPTGNNGLATIPVGVSNVVSMDVTLQGSGAIDNIRVTSDEELVNGRFTGGGHQLRVGEARVTRGLTIHCDLLLSNNLEVNWGGNQFHMTEHLTTIECSDDPEINQAPPPAPLDTLVGVGTGRYNGTNGYTIEFTLVDYGEPGRDDRAALLIYETANPTNIALSVPLQVLSGGNLQAHYDQPHK